MFEWNQISTVDLPETRDTRRHTETAPLPVLVKEPIITDGHGARTHQAHIALQYIEELWQFINAGLSQNPANRSDPRIVLDFEYGTLHFVQM